MRAAKAAKDQQRLPALSPKRLAPRPERVALNDGRSMPAFGLGVWQAPKGACEKAVLHALRAGYRHVDTAEIYRNESDVGAALATFLKESGVSRDEIWITTKFFPRAGKGAAAVASALKGSLKKLRLAYVDLYLIHAPTVKDLRLEQWRAMEDMQAQGLCKSIGVSNYGVHHLKELLGACRVKPAVNQCEVNPYITRADLCAFCAIEGIAVEAYSPLTRGQKLGDPRLLKIAKKVGLTPAQTLIRWCLQKGYVVIPKSVTPARIDENMRLDAPIPDAEMAALDALDQYLVTGWDPTRGP